MAEQIKHLTTDDYAISKWAGGTTTQVGIGPQGAVYADRDFLWRISSATVELPESDFSALGDYERYIATLEGGMRLQHDGGDFIDLAPFDVHRFDGGAKTHSWGCCTDFNLMLRKGKCSGDLRAIHLKGTETIEPKDYTDLILYCAAGSCKLGQLELRAGEAAHIQNQEQPLTITGDASLMAAGVKIL